MGGIMRHKIRDFIKFKLTGISTPVGGISWETCDSNKEEIRKLFLYLKSKRILINPTEMEIPEQCVESVLEIRSELVETIKNINLTSKIWDEVNKMIIACNTYLDEINKLKLPHIIYKSDNRWEDINFDYIMKRFRKDFKDSILNLEKICNLKSNINIPDKY